MMTEKMVKCCCMTNNDDRDSKWLIRLEWFMVLHLIGKIDMGLQLKTYFM